LSVGVNSTWKLALGEYLVIWGTGLAASYITTRCKSPKWILYT